MAIAKADTPLLVASSVELDDVLKAPIPVLLYIGNGETIRADVKNELDKIAREQAGRVLVVKADAARAPEVGARFDVNKHALIVGWANGAEVARRSRPWASDVQGMLEALLPYAPAPVEPPSKKDDKALANGKPVKVTEATFREEVIESSLPVLVDFWAEWCGPCRQIAPTLERLAAEFAGKVRIAKVNVDENPGLAQAFGIMSIPTLMFVKNGKIVGQQAGALPEHTLRNALQQLVALKV